MPRCGQRHHDAALFIDATPGTIQVFDRDSDRRDLCTKSPKGGAQPPLDMRAEGPGELDPMYANINLHNASSVVCVLLRAVPLDIRVPMVLGK
jgi:hypothetical protein